MLSLTVDRASEISLIKQVYQQIRSLILRGVMKPGDKLPSTRDLASSLNVSRNVILEAYDLLTAEGYIESTMGSGTYVAEGTSLENSKASSVIQNNAAAFNPEPQEFKRIDFRSGIPDLDLLPRRKWSQLQQSICLDSPSAVFGYDSPQGRSELRQALCRHLKKSRSVECLPDQIIITSGAVQGLAILSKALLSSGQPYVIEDPIHRDIRNIFTFNSSRIFPVPVDESGLRTELLPQNSNPALIMLTPSHQYPLGVILPVQRRIDLIEYARSKECYIIEDDYDSEFRYEGPSISSMQGLEPNWVIYIGSFSKILFPALRLGYMVVPPALIEQCRSLKHLQDNHTPILTQLTLARFIADGYLEKHIAKMKKIYQRKRDFLSAKLQDAFPNRVNISGQSTGLHLIAELKGVNFTSELLNTLKNAGILVYPVEDHSFVKGHHSAKIIIGYSHLNNQAISEGVMCLQKALAPLL